MHLAYTVGAIFALSLAGFAQTVGQVTGVVTDPSGSIVVGATVTITNSQTNVSRTTTTNGAGNYAFPALQPGVYNVRADMRGFQREAREGVQLRLDAFNTFNHPNFGDPGNRVNANQLDANGVPIPGTGSFGRITSTKTGVDMRELQVSLKVVF